MEIPIYINIANNAIKTTPIHVLQNTSGVKLKFIPYNIVSDQRYVSHINEDEVYPPYPEEEFPQPNEFNFVAITFQLPNGDCVTDATSGDIYEIPIEMTQYSGELSAVLEFYKADELVMQTVNTLLILDEREEPQEPITLEEHYPILQELIKQVQQMKDQLTIDCYTKQEVDDLFKKLSEDNGLIWEVQDENQGQD